MSRDGTVWRISIREDAKWENGEPINADSFIYSWKMCLGIRCWSTLRPARSPETSSRSRNARAYFGQASSDPKVRGGLGRRGHQEGGRPTIELELAGSYSDVEVMRHLTMKQLGLGL